MNLILFDKNEMSSEMRISLAADDERVIHLKKILKAGAGSVFGAGIINGKTGTAAVETIGSSGAIILFTPGNNPAGLHPLTLILGLSRPPTVKKVLKEATALGIRRFLLCGTENSEKSYIQSSALKADKIHKTLIEGVQQAVCTQLPEVSIEHSLRCALEKISADTQESSLLALDNYEATISLSEYWRRTNRNNSPYGQTESPAVTLAVGSERGWTDRERQRLRDAGFTLCSLGPRVLRTETASIAGAAICLSGMGLV